MTNSNQRHSFEEIFREYYRAVFSFFFKKGFPKEECEDLAQKTFLRVYECWDQYRGDAIWGYLVETARSVLSNHLRKRDAVKRGHGITRSLDDPGSAEAAAITFAKSRAVATPLDILQIKAEKGWVVAALKDLSNLERRCVLLWIDGRSFKAIGTAMGCTSQAAKSRCFRVREKLRKRWEEEQREEPQA